MQAAIDALIASGEETGLQVAVLHAGHVVADAVAGIADERTGAPVEPDTLFFAASACKSVATSVAHVLVDHGELDYAQRVANVLPEFGAHRKYQVTVRDVLVHAAGVPGLWPDITPVDLGDWDRVCYSQARLGARSRPGSTFGMVGSNGSAAYADIDSGVAVAVMHNRIVGDFTAVTAIDAVVAAHHG